jgi:hypothetical protein
VWCVVVSNVQTGRVRRKTFDRRGEAFEFIRKFRQPWARRRDGYRIELIPVVEGRAR